MSYKKEQFIECIKHSVDIFLSQNSEEVGFGHVEIVNISNDFRQAHVFLSFVDNVDFGKKIQFLEFKKKEISDIIKKEFKLRNIPKLNFKVISSNDIPVC